MDCAIITGADNPVGQAIARRVVDMGHRVYGLGQFKTKPSFEHRQFHPLGCDLTQPGKIAQAAEVISREKKVVTVLIHASAFVPGLLDSPEFEKWPPGQVETALRMQFLGPVLLTRLFLPQLLGAQGHVVFVSPQSPGEAIANPALAGAVAGLQRFAGQLFSDCREQGLRVTSFYLQSNSADRPTGPESTSEKQEHISPRQVARAVEHALQTAAEGNVITELVLRPQIPDGATPLPKTGTAVDPYREIMLPPPENFPSEPQAARRPRPRTFPTIEPGDLEKVDVPEPKLRSEGREATRATEAKPSGESGEGSTGKEGEGRRRRRSRGRRGRGRQREAETSEAVPVEAVAESNSPGGSPVREDSVDKPKEEKPPEAPAPVRKRGAKKKSASKKKPPAKEKDSAAKKRVAGKKRAAKKAKKS